MPVDSVQLPPSPSTPPINASIFRLVIYLLWWLRHYCGCVGKDSSVCWLDFIFWVHAAEMRWSRNWNRNWHWHAVVVGRGVSVVSLIFSRSIASTYNTRISNRSRRTRFRTWTTPWDTRWAWTWSTPYQRCLRLCCRDDVMMWMWLRYCIITRIVQRCISRQRVTCRKNRRLHRTTNYVRQLIRLQWRTIEKKTGSCCERKIWKINKEYFWKRNKKKR